MKEIDMKTYKKRSQFAYFRTFLNPNYGFDTEIDVTVLVSFCKEHHYSFFPCFLFAIMKGVNEIVEMRMRIVSDKPVLYDVVHPTFTVMTKNDVYVNAGFEMKEDFPSFYSLCRKIVDEAKGIEEDDFLHYPICNEPNVLYATCVPILKYAAMSHPLPLGNAESMTIPRSCFGKYYEKEDGHTYVLLNFTVSHLFVDGYPLAKCFNRIQEIVNDLSYFR